MSREKNRCEPSRRLADGHAEVVSLLLKHGADPCLEDADGWTPVVRVMLDDGIVPLISAIHRERQESILAAAPQDEGCCAVQAGVTC